MGAYVIVSVLDQGPAVLVPLGLMLLLLMLWVCWCVTAAASVVDPLTLAVMGLAAGADASLAAHAMLRKSHVEVAVRADADLAPGRAFVAVVIAPDVLPHFSKVLQLLWTVPVAALDLHVLGGAHAFACPMLSCTLLDWVVDLDCQHGLDCLTVCQKPKHAIIVAIGTPAELAVALAGPGCFVLVAANAVTEERSAVPVELLKGLEEGSLVKSNRIPLEHYMRLESHPFY